jgi:hypothetical protein
MHMKLICEGKKKEKEMEKNTYICGMYPYFLAILRLCPRYISAVRSLGICILFTEQ